MRLPQLGSLWMLLAALSFATMGTLVKLGAKDFSTAELVFYRSAFGLVAVYVMIAQQKLSIATPALPKQISRALVGLISLVLFFYAISYLPLATAITLNYTSGLFLALLTPMMLHERPKKSLYAMIVLGFIGVALLLKPSFSNQNAWAGLMGLLSGFGAALAYVHVKQLAKLDEPDWRTVFYFTLISTIASGIWMLAHHFSAPSWNSLPILIGLGISATIGQLAMTRAYRTGNTLIVASLSYTTVIFATLFGMLFWQEKLTIDEYFAMALIMLSGVISVMLSDPSKAK